MLCLVFIAFAVAAGKIHHHVRAASFLERHPWVAPQDGRPRFETRFVTLEPNRHNHAACLVELPDGRVRAFWYSGSREGARDVEVRTAVFDPGGGAWGAEKTAASAAHTERSVWRYVLKVGNPAAILTTDGTLWLFYVTVSVGGWGGSSITAVTSQDGGETWSGARRLVSSPFLNLGMLVRGEPFEYADGTIGLPGYQELIGISSELLRVDSSGTVVDRQRLSAAALATQPVVLVRSSTNAIVLMRSPRLERSHSVQVAMTHDAGRVWSPPAALPLANPDAALSGVVLPDGRIVVALNDAEAERDVLSLVVSGDGGLTWRTARQLETQLAARTAPVDDARYDRAVESLARGSDRRVGDARAYVESSRRFMCWEPRCHFEFSYPFIIQTRQGDFHVVYTWNRSFIKHVQFNLAWLDESPASSTDASLH